MNSGSFRFNNSTTERYLIFDVAAHEGNIHYDNLDLTVTSSGGPTNYCRRPVLSFCELNASNLAQPKARLFWSAQPGLTVAPEWSPNLTGWLALTNGSGGPLSVTTPHGSMQWLEVTSPVPLNQPAYFRLRSQ